MSYYGVERWSWQQQQHLLPRPRRQQPAEGHRLQEITCCCWKFLHEEICLSQGKQLQRRRNRGWRNTEKEVLIGAWGRETKTKRGIPCAPFTPWDTCTQTHTKSNQLSSITSVLGENQVEKTNSGGQQWMKQYLFTLDATSTQKKNCLTESSHESNHHFVKKRNFILQTHFNIICVCVSNLPLKSSL